MNVLITKQLISKRISPSVKAAIKQKIKDIGSLCFGYGFYYAQTQDIKNYFSYSHQWSEIITPIKQRSGSPEVNENRLWNMEISARGIDGLVLNPTAVFGFWNRVSRPIVANGFREGPMLVGNRLITDVGGGLCQISTTLFQALLWANCEIIERSNHSIDAHGDNRFFTLGQDATVAYGYKDLIVKNDTQIPLMLRLQILKEKSQAIASVWGQEPKPVKVKIESNILEEIPVNNAKGMSGWQVETIRYVQPCLNNNHEDINWQINYHVTDIYKPYVQLY
ncbi:MAG: VanW family protein [Cyanobacteria bacterium P01_A01_bin.84]